jgi:hypothetical protein
MTAEHGRCDSVYHLPLPLDVRCTDTRGHDGEHRSGWMSWADDNEHARRLEPS